ncbi:MAG: hypothetical protein QM791_04090 [Ferruginibacter sp.]
MANCALTQDYSFGCDFGAGGVYKDCYLIELENVSATPESSGTVTSVTKVTGKIFRKYQLVKETASFDETIGGNQQNGTIFYDQKGVIIINKQSVQMRNEIMLLAKNRLVVIARDNNGLWKLYGREQGLQLLDGSITTGVQFTDRNGYVLNFTSKEREPAPFVSEDVIATLQTAT